jgi:hypothetical protein
MKTKNNLLKGIIIGVCGIIVPLILMGTTYTTENKNTWEFHIKDGVDNGWKSGWLLNTVTGEIHFVKGDERSICREVDQIK